MGDFCSEDLKLENKLLRLEDHVKYREMKVFEIRKDLSKETAAYEQYFHKMVFNQKGDSRLLREESGLSEQKTTIDEENALNKKEEL